MKGCEMNALLNALRHQVAERGVEGLKSTLIPRVDLFKVTQPLALPAEIYPPFISLIVQGEKTLRVGDRLLTYSAGQVFIASFDLPATGYIPAASEAEPYLAVRLTLDFTLLGDLLLQMPLSAEISTAPAFAIGTVSEALLEAWLRMVRLSDRPEEIKVMAPLLEREILFRTLQGAQGEILRQAVDIQSHFSKLRAAIAFMRSHSASPLRITDLARLAGMSLSVFHRRFKASTGLTPLQYQKQLRLYEARSLLLRRPGNVAAVAAEVGYQSLTQFTREYARLFGNPPARDSKNLRRSADTDTRLPWE